MKKAILLLCMAAGLISCAKDILDNEKDNTQKEGVPMTFNVTVLETKAAKTDWADGDKIYVFFNGLETKYLVLERSSGVWTNTSGGGTLLDTDFDGLGTKKLTAVHFPVALDVAYADGKFSFTSGGKPLYNYYLYETGKDYTVDGTTVTATLSMGKPANMVQFHVAGIQDNIADYTFGCSKIKPVACTSVGTDGAITESVLQAGARLSGVADSDGAIFAGLLTTTGAANYKFTVASDANIYTLTRDDKTLTAGKMYNFPSLSTTGGSNWAVTAASDLYVDLGFEVGGKKIYWAKCNVGAANPENYGYYFAWGETTGEGKNYYPWSTYAWGSSKTALTKYCNNSSSGKDGFTDALTTLLPEDDAAYADLGGKWRTPTDAEWTWLLDNNNCTWTWTSQSGVTGVLVTSKIAGYTSNTIFLPAAGFWHDAYASEVGSHGYYWSSSLDESQSANSLYLYFAYSNYKRLSGTRNCGLPVRPVYSE